MKSEPEDDSQNVIRLYNAFAYVVYITNATFRWKTPDVVYPPAKSRVCDVVSSVLLDSTAWRSVYLMSTQV